VKIEEEARLIDIKIIQGCESYHLVIPCELRRYTN
jgi:hypothetical protein